MGYIVIAIDVFTQFALEVPVNSKDAGSITIIFAEVFRLASPRLHKRLHTDKGNVFFNFTLSALMKRNKIHQFAIESDIKPDLLQSFNRSIKTRLYTYLSVRGYALKVDICQNFTKRIKCIFQLDKRQFS
jgi:hypothetical protein